MTFEWDPDKNEANIRQYGISFEQAREVFGDPLHISFLEKQFSYLEARWITVGQTRSAKVVVAAHLCFGAEPEEVVPIISAREATVNERRQYESK